MSRNVLAFCLLGLFSLVPVAYAGSQINETPVLDASQIARLSKLVERTAAEQGARVFIIARRSGGRELPKAIQYTHTAVAVYSQAQAADGRILKTYAVHNLYQLSENPQLSVLEQDYPFDFLASATALEAGLLIPVPSLQKKLLEAVTSGHPAAIHESSYSAIANPHSARFQNCTEFVLDLINAAIYETRNRKELKRIAQEWFKPTPLNISPLKLTAASFLAADIRTSDHRGPVKTATFGSIASYLESHDLLQTRIDLAL